MLNHPNIVQVYDFGNVEGHYFLAMEYLRGYDVLAIIKQLRDMKRPFPVPVVAFIAHEVAGCLGYAHGLTGPDGLSLDIVHRDVSPSNVMCLREGGVKLLDFGIASALSEVQPEQTDQGTFRGKLAYMAPERLRNEPVDGRADLYSLGVMLWEMLTCRRLFRGASDAETLKNVLDMTVPPPSAQRPEVPPSLDAVIKKALARDLGARYQTGQAMADDLEEVMRETKFKSRMPPKLLVDLFGSGVHSSQIAMSCVTPEMLAAAAAADNSSTGSVARAAAATGRSLWRSRRLWAAVATIALAIALALALRPERVDSRAASPSVRPPPASIPAIPPAPAPVVAPPAVPTAAAPPAATEPKKASRGKRSARTRAQHPDDPITKGLSIDPFAEAAKRGQK
jgi:serine/threonine protein kinase